MNYTTKRLIAICLLIFGYCIAKSAPVTPEQAVLRLQKHAALKKLPNSVDLLSMIRVIDDSRKMPAIYLMQNSGGFMLLPADDRAPALLGYGSHFDADNIPPAMQEWMDCYAEQIAYIAENNITVESYSLEHAEIPYLLKSTWKQEKPYNNMCPLDGGTRSITGCVATAMAQIMYYHKWPADTGRGTYSYEWRDKTLSFDYEATHFDWNSMLDSYDNSKNYPEESKSAVATLMYAAGVSVEMNYSADASAAKSEYVADALYSFFGYGNSVEYIRRLSFSDEEWDNIIYSELHADRPVYYSGKSNSDGSGGHAFVCDGYGSDGYYHINWGWGGYCDGYFLLSVMNPYDNKGYNFNQNAIIGIQPEGHQIGDRRLSLISPYGGFHYIGFKFGETNHGFIFLDNQNRPTGYYNYSRRDINGYDGIRLTHEDGSHSHIFGTHRTLQSFYGFSFVKAFLPKDLQPGTYHASPEFIEDGAKEWQDIKILYGCPKNVEIRIGNNGAVTYDGSNPDDKPAAWQITDFKLKTATPLVPGTDFNASITIKNPNDFAITCHPTTIQTLTPDGCNLSDTRYYTLSVNANQSQTYTIRGTLPDIPDGIYYLQVGDYENSRWCTEPIRICIGVEPTSVTVSPSTCDLEIEETCRLAATVLPADAFDTSVVWKSQDDNVATVSNDGLVTGIAEGETIVSATTANELTAYVTVKVTASGGIEAVKADKIDNGIPRFYDLNGRFVGNTLEGLAPGVYILRQSDFVTKTIIR